ncbi:hypothetical protein GXM_01396 [Nostoc sphaeroides CCNUC1]|uniref:Uncharacterized protein n=1 Tax=Nostoc sphaeroides CCNUC1 TaxID=2653204 RepID=A0A5P8VU48_9NOSO|nr:hypothetical protein GXM_01396 [Nostoc sphaeroides CCNUC1]
MSFLGGSFFKITAIYLKTAVSASSWKRSKILSKKPWQ